MGVSVNLASFCRDGAQPGEDAELCAEEINTTRHNTGAVTYTGREIYITAQGVDASASRDFHPKEMQVRIHGVTVHALISALLDHEETRKAIALGVRDREIKGPIRRMRT